MFVCECSAHYRQEEAVGAGAGCYCVRAYDCVCEVIWLCVSMDTRL
jgi:hypothetical protein